MMTFNKLQHILYNRLLQVHGLLFFFILFIASCRQHAADSRDIHLYWNASKATRVGIPTGMLPEKSLDSVQELLAVRISGDTTATKIIGKLIVENEIIFEPLLPFTNGMSYTILFKGDSLSSFTVPESKSDTPRLLAVYPAADTVPENLLKIYLQFSAPMQEGRSADHIFLLKNGTDTLHNIFLDLQPELWNADRTVLTLWLDPGRIKRDLQPNLRLGNPLHPNEHYSLVISSKWRDARSIGLQKNYIHSFTAGGRDSLSPDPGKWVIEASRQKIRIALTKSLDHFLLSECLQVLDRSGKPVSGHFEPTAKDDHCLFIPGTPILPGNYMLRVATKLEDLAGNNVNRVFDRDIIHSKAPSTNTYYTRSFSIN